MPQIKLTIGKYKIISEDLPIHIFLKINNLLKRFSSGLVDGYHKLDWRALAFKDELIEKLRNAKADGDFINDLSSLLNTISEKVDRTIMEENEILFLSINANPIELAKQIGGEFKIRVIENPEIGRVEAPYISIPYHDIVKLQKIVEDPSVPSSFKDVIKEFLEKQPSEKLARISRYGVKFIEIRIPKFSQEGLIEEIKELGTIKYYVPDPSSEEPVLKEEKLYKVQYKRNEIVIMLPSYALSRLYGVLSKYGFNAKIEFDIPAQLKVRIRKNFTLYPHQEEAISSWIKAKKMGTIVIPTGGGKTHVALGAIAELRVPTIIFVPNKLLLWQWRDRVSKFLDIPKEKIGILGAGERIIKEITIATYQSGVRYIDKIADKFSFVVFDEGHHVPAKTFKEVALYLLSPYRMALSATPKRHDKNEILLFKLSGKIVYEISYADLVRRGFLAPLAVRKILVPLSPELHGMYEKLAREVDLARTPLEKKQRINKLIEIARDNPEKIRVIREIVQKHRDEKIFIFTGSIKFAEMIATSIKDIIPVAVLTAKTSEIEEKSITKSFIEGHIRALVLVKKGEEGLDVGDASVAIIAGGTKQVREFIQRVGRVLRGGPSKLAWVYEIVTRNTIEEGISKARRARDLVLGIEDFIYKNFGVRAFRVIRYDILHRID